jgi:hypothetical protein
MGDFDARRMRVVTPALDGSDVGLTIVLAGCTSPSALGRRPHPD